MSLLFASLLAWLGVEYFSRLPFIATGRALTRVANKSVRVVLSKKISDHWKEVVLLRYAKGVLTQSLLIAVMLMGCVVLIGVPALCLDWIFELNPSTLGSISSLPGFLSMSLSAGVYLALRRRLGRV